MTIYAVACVNYSPPKVNSVWSERQLATDRRDHLIKIQPGVHKVFPVVLDSGKFDVGVTPWNDKRYEKPAEG